MLRSAQRLGGTQECLGRHARPIRACAPDEFAFHDDRGESALHRPVGDILASRPAAQDDQVVFIR
jgi:hypothetical protein